MAKKKSERQKQLEILINAVFGRANKDLKKHSAALKRLTKDEQQVIRTAQRRAAVVAAGGTGVTPGTSTTTSRAQSRFRVTRSQKFFQIGAEGVRISHFRFNQAGRISLSERTALGAAGGIGIGVVIGGQLAGSAAEAGIRIRDEYRRGGDATKVALTYGKDQLRRLLAMAGQLTGVTKLATSVASLVTGASWEQADEAIEDLALLLFGSDESIQKRATAKTIAPALMEAKNRGIANRSRQRARATDLTRIPQDVESRMEFLREELGFRADEDRIMVRDITNVPLWRRVRLPINSGS